MAGLRQANHTRVLVTWHDAHTEGGWMSPDEIERGPFLIQTVGYLLPDGKPGHLTVAQSVGLDGDVDALLHIPVGMVQTVKVL